MRWNGRVVLLLLALFNALGSGASHAADDMPPCGGVLDPSFHPTLPPPPIPMNAKQKAAAKHIDKKLDKLRAQLKKGKLTSEKWEATLSDVQDDIEILNTAPDACRKCYDAILESEARFIKILRALDDRLFIKAKEQKEWTTLGTQYSELISLLSGEEGSYDARSVQEALKGLEEKGVISKKSRMILQAILTELGLHADCSLSDDEYVALPPLDAGVEYWHRALAARLLYLQEQPPDFEDELYTLSRTAPCFQAMTVEKCHQFVLPSITETLSHAQAFDLILELGDEIRLAKKANEPLAVIDENAIKTREKILIDYPATLKQESYAVLDAVAELLEAHPEILLVEVQGHMESKGKDSVNLSLSQERADRVREYLEDSGVEPARLTAKGYGETRPILCNKTEDCVGLSERIDFIILERAKESES